MNPYYNQNYTRKEVEAILLKIKNCILSGNYSISLNSNRKENIDFINTYNIRSEKQKNILMQITIDDFCHSLQNTKSGYEDETIYVFVPQVQLTNPNGQEEIVDIYTKFNIIEVSFENKLVVISFHKKNKPIKYLFR